MRSWNDVEFGRPLVPRCSGGLAVAGRAELDQGIHMRILAIDVGGTHVKILAKGEKEKRQIDSGPTMTARLMVSSVDKLARGCTYDVVSIGIRAQSCATGRRPNR